MSSPLVTISWTVYGGRLAAGEVGDSFTVSLHSTNGRHLPAIRAVQGDWLSVTSEKQWKFPPVMWATMQLRQSQPIFRPANHKSWYQPNGSRVSYPTDRQGRTVKQSSSASKPSTQEAALLCPCWAQTALTYHWGGGRVSRYTTQLYNTPIPQPQNTSTEIVCTQLHTHMQRYKTEKLPRQALLKTPL